MAMTVRFDPRAIAATLLQIGERAEKRGAEALRKGAHEIQRRARNYAPVEHHGLEQAIEVSSDHSGINRRRVYYVYVDPDAPELSASGEPTGRTVGRYLYWIHEGDYNLGKRSLAKSYALGVQVGPKFLERAADEVLDSLNQAVANYMRGIF
jgi:hypothetical protein